MSKLNRFGLGALVGVLLAAGGVLAGDLTPPGPPGATMRTLQEIYDKLDDIDAKIEGGGAAVPMTGQTATVPINPAPAGSDGDLQKGVAWPDPRFTDNSNGTVTDNLTGLVWLKNANAFGTRTWANALADCAALKDGDHGLTDGSTAGDWRLPNVRELHSLIDYGRFNPSLPSGHPFAGVQSGSYWSSSTFADSTDVAWVVYLDFGYVYFGSKSATYYVWPVRGGQ